MQRAAAAFRELACVIRIARTGGRRVLNYELAQRHRLVTPVRSEPDARPRSVRRAEGAPGVQWVASVADPDALDRRSRRARRTQLCRLAKRLRKEAALQAAVSPQPLP